MEIFRGCVLFFNLIHVIVKVHVAAHLRRAQIIWKIVFKGRNGHEISVFFSVIHRCQGLQFLNLLQRTLLLRNHLTWRQLITQRRKLHTLRLCVNHKRQMLIHIGIISFHLRKTFLFPKIYLGLILPSHNIDQLLNVDRLLFWFHRWQAAF